MATKKNLPAVKTPTNTNLVALDAMMAADVAALKNQIAPVTGQMIRVSQDKRFKFPDGGESAGPFAGVVVDFVTYRRWYPAAYDDKNISPPACFALSSQPKGMNPSPNSPELQNPPEKGGCDTCPQNQWGSDPNRDGKACKEHRRMAILPAPDGKHPLKEDTPIWLMEVSPTGLKPFDGFIAGVAKTFNKPPVGVTVDFGFDPQRSYPSVRLSDPQPNPEAAAYYARKPEALELLLAEPDVSSYGQEPAKPAARGKQRPAARR